MRQKQKQKRSTVRDAWKSFRDEVIPADAPPVQIQEMRRAFYAGVWTMLTACWEITDDSVSVAEGIARLESWSQECRSFQADVLKGLA